MNRKARRRAAKVKAGDIIQILQVYNDDTDEELGWYWCVHGPSSLKAGIREAHATGQMHGPFTSQEAAVTNMEAVRFPGERIKRNYAGAWKPAWDKPQ